MDSKRTSCPRPKDGNSLPSRPASLPSTDDALSAEKAPAVSCPEATFANRDRQNAPNSKVIVAIDRRMMPAIGTRVDETV